MNITGLKNKRKILIAEIKVLERIPEYDLGYKNRAKLRAFIYQVRWIGKEINRMRTEKQSKNKKQ